MKGKRGSDSGGKAFGRITGMAVTGILSMFLLTGCSRERMETRREIDRIYKAAEQTAKDRAAAYITEKYGIDASPQVSDGELREKQTANYFSDIYPIDCAVLSANAQSCPKCCTLLPVLLSA